MTSDVSGTSGVEIGGFWRRLFAFLIDMFLLGLVGGLLTYAFFDQLVQLGDLGRVIGFGIALVYFGVTYSSLTGGQTAGKWLLGLRVLDRQGQFLSPLKGMARYSIWAVPYFGNGLNVQLGSGVPDLVRWFVWGVLAVVVFGGLFSVVYLFVFNRKTRQSLHDLVMGTFVVRTGAAGRPIRDRIWPGHLWINTGLLGVLAMGLVTLGLYLPMLSFFSELNRVRRAVSRHPKVIRASVKKNWTRSARGQSTSLSATVVTRSWEDRGSIHRTVARDVVRNYENLDGIDRVVVQVRYGVDIGIFSWWYKDIRGSPVSELREKPSQDL